MKRSSSLTSALGRIDDAKLSSEAEGEGEGRGDGAAEVEKDEDGKGAGEQRSGRQRSIEGQGKPIVQ